MGVRPPIGATADTQHGVGDRTLELELPAVGLITGAGEALVGIDGDARVEDLSTLLSTLGL